MGSVTSDRIDLRYGNPSQTCTVVCKHLRQVAMIVVLTLGPDFHEASTYAEAGSCGLTQFRNVTCSNASKNQYPASGDTLAYEFDKDSLLIFNLFAPICLKYVSMLTDNSFSFRMRGLQCSLSSSRFVAVPISIEMSSG